MGVTDPGAPTDNAFPPPERLVQQSASTFLRVFDGIAYLYDQVSRRDIVYDSTGAVFLRHVGRTSRTLGALVSKLEHSYPDVPPGDLFASLAALVSDLEERGHLVTGADPAELELRQGRLSYRAARAEPHASAEAQTDALPSSSDVLFDHCQLRPRLLNVQIDVTSRCNERCCHCFLPRERHSCDLDAALALDVLDQLGEIGALFLTFGGGEPFLHPDFEALLRRARERDLCVTIITNGTLIDDRWALVLRDLGLAEVQLSLYSMDPVEHDGITRVRGSHKKTLDAVERLLAADVPARLSCPVMKSNRHAYADVLRFAHDRGMRVSTDSVLLGCTNMDTSNLVSRLDLQETEELLRGMLVWDREFRSRLALRGAVTDRAAMARRAVCGAGVDALFVAPNGDFRACPVLDRKVGDARNDRVCDVWRRSVPLQQIRDTTWADFPQCLDCEAIQYCSMCLARNCAENQGAVHRCSQHCCDVAFLSKRLLEEHGGAAQTSAADVRPPGKKTAFRLTTYRPADRSGRDP